MPKLSRECLAVADVESLAYFFCGPLGCGFYRLWSPQFVFGAVTEGGGSECTDLRNPSLLDSKILKSVVYIQCFSCNISAEISSRTLDLHISKENFSVEMLLHKKAVRNNHAEY